MMKSGTPVGAFFRRISLRDFLLVTQIALCTSHHGFPGRSARHDAVATCAAGIAG